MGLFDIEGLSLIHTGVEVEVEQLLFVAGDKLCRLQTAFSLWSLK